MLKTKLRVLIDTNIIIHSEDNKEISEEVKKFHQSTIFFDVVVHPFIIYDIERDSNVERKNVALSKLWKYNKIDFNAEPDSDFYKNIKKPIKHNDAIDDRILFTLFCWACDYLVTEDRGIHKKAYILWIKDKVFSLEKFNQYISSLFPVDVLSLDSFKNIIHDKIAKISPRPIDEIFDTLKGDYPDFENWYKRIIREERKWFFIVWEENLIYGLCLYDEKNPEYADGIKISTFKVSAKKKWSKEGEKLLRQMMVYAMQNQKAFLYIEVKKDNDFIDWLLTFWFYRVWDKIGDVESVVLKKDIFPPQTDKGVVNNYPFYYFWENTNIFLIPIQSRFSEKLFPEIHSQLQLQIEDNSCWNTMKKSYLSWKNNKKMKEWDIVFFYETATGWWIAENNMRIISIWVVEETLYTQDHIDAIKFIWKRSVYTAEEIQAKALDWTFILNFRHLDELFIKPNFNELCQNWILNWAPQSILSINREYYGYLKTLLWSYYQ